MPEADHMSHSPLISDKHCKVSVQNKTNTTSLTLCDCVALTLCTVPCAPFPPGPTDAASSPRLPGRCFFSLFLVVGSGWGAKSLATRTAFVFCFCRIFPLKKRQRRRRRRCRRCRRCSSSRATSSDCVNADLDLRIFERTIHLVNARLVLVPLV